MSLVVRSTRFLSGERYRLLVDADSGMPLYYPNLFVTTQVRNHSQSVAAMEKALNAIKHLLSYCSETALELRIREKRFFTTTELDAIRDHCQRFSNLAQRPATLRSRGVLALPRGAEPRVGKDYQYSRLSIIASYFEWLVETVHHPGLTPELRSETERVARGLRRRRPRYRSRSQVDGEDKALSEKAEQLLHAVIEPGHPANPFTDPAVAERNYLIVKLVASLGLRAGELLGIRISDVDFQACTVTIHRRADDREDSRLKEPNAKTLGRILPVSRGLTQRVAQYVTDLRSAVPNAGYNEFLFISHKSGPTQGNPIAQETLRKIFKRLSSVDPELGSLHPHALRHTWNSDFSKKIDEMASDQRPSEAVEEQMRNQIMGWKQGSGSAATYNKRHIKRKADAASLALQEKMNEKRKQ